MTSQTTDDAVVAQVTEERSTQVGQGIGANAKRPDGVLKVTGEFAYSSDLGADDMLWGVTLRSPHPSARIRGIDVSRAAGISGVRAVLTHSDVPGRKTYGVERPDQPVLAWDVVRYQGEPVAVVAATDPETARRACEAIVVDYEVLEPLSDPVAAMNGVGPVLHGRTNVLRHVTVRHGDIDAAMRHADVIVSGEYELGMQDQAFLGPESGLAMPAADGGVELFVATQWLHVDRGQVAASLDLPPEMVRMTNAGVGGAFGGREDISVQIHACMLALRTGRPIKMVYSREESFFGHVHRHPAKMRYEHGATREGDLVFVKAHVLFDGGAYASTSKQVCETAASFATGPYEVPSALVDSVVVYTNNPPCGAMRGFGCVQVCFAHESQMDKLAAAVGLDPIALRKRNAMKRGTVQPTGQRIDQPAPVLELIERLEAVDLPPERSAQMDPIELPGGASNTTHGEGVRRGVGYAVGFKNIGFGAGFDDYSTARVRVALAAEEPFAEVHTAACEVGQGGVTVHAQIVRTMLGLERVVVLPNDTQIGNAGSTSASRQTWFTGGAVKQACDAVREEIFARAREEFPTNGSDLDLVGGNVVDAESHVIASIAEVVGDRSIDLTREYRTRRTTPMDEHGQGDPVMAFAFAAHRAVVDVDLDLGLIRVVDIVAATDAGTVLNPLSVLGQIEGATAQGIGLALMEEIQVRDSRVLNPSFTDYLIPTTLDMPPVRSEVLELAQPNAPFGVNGVGESGIMSSGPAVIAALRAATGRALTRMPVRPDEIVGLPATNQ